MIQVGSSYECPIHGKHDATMHIRVADWVERVFCMKCYVTALERVGVREMLRVDRDDDRAEGLPTADK